MIYTVTHCRGRAGVDESEVERETVTADSPDAALAMVTNWPIEQTGHEFPIARNPEVKGGSGRYCDYWMIDAAKFAFETGRRLVQLAPGGDQLVVDFDSDYAQLACSPTLDAPERAEAMSTDLSSWDLDETIALADLRDRQGNANYAIIR